MKRKNTDSESLWISLLAYQPAGAQDTGCKTTNSVTELWAFKTTFGPNLTLYKT